jgi:hypothetical protein
MDMGFNPSNAVLTKFDLSQAGYSGEAAEQVPAPAAGKGIAAAGSGSSSLREHHALSQDTNDIPVFLNKRPIQRLNKAFDTYLFDVSPGYFAAAQTPLLDGTRCKLYRQSQDAAGCHRESAVRPRLFHSDHAVGRYFKDSSGKSIQIVGMVADGKYFLLSEDPQETQRSSPSAETNYERHRSSSAPGRIPPGWPCRYGSHRPQSDSRSRPRHSYPACRATGPASLH